MPTTIVVDHPLVAVLLSRVRDQSTGRAAFAAAVERLGSMLVYEAARSLTTEAATVRTPLADAPGARLCVDPFLVCVLRAGLGLLGPAQRPLPAVDERLDERLDERAFIVPGLGDAGDRLFGTP